MVYVSISMRIKTDAEALNMVEPSGSYVKHRIVPLVVSRSEGRYRVINVPAVSGQSLAYAYQVALVKLALIRNLPLCNACKNYHVIGGFIKQSGDFKKCVVEDLTGFMIARGEGQPASRRTSIVSFSYMIPDLHSSSTQIVPQMHVRFNQVKPEEQAVFEVESASAIYTLLIGMDIDRVGLMEIGEVEQNKREYVTKRDEISLQDKCKRVELAFDALTVMFDGLVYGAKKSRYKPRVEILGSTAAISDPLPFEASPACVRSLKEHYINDTIKRAVDYLKVINEQKIWIYYFTSEKWFTDDEERTLTIESNYENIDEKRLQVCSAESFADLVAKAKEKVKELLKCKEVS